LEEIAVSIFRVAQAEWTVLKKEAFHSFEMPVTDRYLTRSGVSEHCNLHQQNFEKLKKHRENFLWDFSFFLLSNHCRVDIWCIVLRCRNSFEMTVSSPTLNQKMIPCGCLHSCCMRWIPFSPSQMIHRLICWRWVDVLLDTDHMFLLIKTIILITVLLTLWACSGIVGWGTVIPSGVNGIFRWLNPAVGTMAWESAQPLIEMDIRDISWVLKSTGALPPLCALYLEIWEPQVPRILTACSGLYRDCFKNYQHLTFKTLMLAIVDVLHR